MWGGRLTWQSELQRRPTARMWPRRRVPNYSRGLVPGQPHTTDSMTILMKSFHWENRGGRGHAAGDRNVTFAQFNYCLLAVHALA